MQALRDSTGAGRPKESRQPQRQHPPQQQHRGLRPGPASRRCRASRREALLLSSAPLLLLADLPDATTVLNSVLGGYGLPRLKASSAWRELADFDRGFFFEYPKAWVRRDNTLRPGLYVSDFNTADKAVLEIFRPDGGEGAAAQLVRRFVSPAQETGGDSKLAMPPARSIRSESASIEGQEYTYVSFPTETVTRSGYNVRRKNFGVAAARRGQLFTLVASARSDQFNSEKEALLRHIIESFRLQP